MTNTLIDFGGWESKLKEHGIDCTLNKNVLYSKLVNHKYGKISLELRIIVLENRPIVKVSGFLDKRYQDKNPDEAIDMFIQDKNVHFHHKD